MPDTFVARNDGHELPLFALANKTAPQTLILRLYTNNYTPIETSVT